MRNLLPIVRDHVYHPDFHGSFSIKSVAPALLGESAYEALDIANGAEATRALERLVGDVTIGGLERDRIHRALLAYCATDTRLLVSLHRWLTVNAIGLS